MAKKHIRDKAKHDNRISRSQINEKKCLNQVAFSFKYLTTNNDYTIDTSNKEDTSILVSKLLEITDEGWLKLTMRRKQNGGYETIPKSMINLSHNELPFVIDKYSVIRYNRDKYRLIGYKVDGCDIFYVLGIDYNFSAYSHG